MIKTTPIRSRKIKKGPEADLVNKFLHQSDELFFEGDLEYTIFQEVYAEAGIPDILIIGWDKKFIKKWSPQRNNLNKNDIKILHHISLFGKRGIKIKKLQEDLGFSTKQIQISMSKIEKSNLVALLKDRVSINNFEEVFFIKKIISVEAKISDWKSALNQAKLNENFSSHSYVLLPNNIINKNLISSINGTTGVLGEHSQGVEIKRKAKKSKLPGSYFSWVLNEYIGSKFAYSNILSAQ